MTLLQGYMLFSITYLLVLGVLVYKTRLAIVSAIVAIPLSVPVFLVVLATVAPL